MNLINSEEIDVSLLGEFLERFYSPCNYPQTIWARARRERLATPNGESSRRLPVGRERQRSKEAKSLTELEFWAQGVDTAREDQTRTAHGETESTAEVTRGTQRLRRVADGSIEVEKEPRRVRGGGENLPNDFRRHFDRSLNRRFFASLSLEYLGECEVAGRRCVRMRAVPVVGDQIWSHWLPTEADEFEFAAELEFPSLLSIRANLAGETFETIEVTQVTFNAEIDETVFDLQPLSGMETREAEPVIRRMTLKAAIAKAPFTVLLPNLAPDFGEGEVHYRPANKKKLESLVVFYHGGDKSLWFYLSATQDSETRGRLEWEEVEFSGRRFQLSDPKVEGAKSVLVFEQQGTWVEIISDLGRDELLRLAASFEAVKP